MDELPIPSESSFSYLESLAETSPPPAAPILSRRRVNKSTSVVLSSAALLKFSSREESEKKASEARQTSTRSVQRAWRRYSQRMFQKRIESTNKISVWWRLQRVLREQRVEMKYMQNGLWTRRQSDLVFGIVLGRRVRKLLQIDFALSGFRAKARDIIVVVQEIVAGSSSSKALEIVSARAPPAPALALSSADIVLIHSLKRQYAANRNCFHEVLFGTICWRTFPSPGYWCFCKAIKAAAVKKKSCATPPPKKTDFTSPSKFNNRATMSSSPLIAATSDSPLQNMNEQASRSRGFANPQRGKLPKPLKDVLSSKQLLSGFRGSSQTPTSAGTFNRVEENLIAKMESPSGGRRPRQSRDGYAFEEFLQQQPTPSGAAVVSSSSSPSISSSSSTPDRSSVSNKVVAPIPLSTMSRSSNKAHIQLDILAAHGLMRASNKSARKPCLRVTLELPSTSASVRASTASSINEKTPLKKHFQVSRNYNEEGLNPSWDCTVHVPLPVPKSLVMPFLKTDEEQKRATGEIGGEMRDDDYQDDEAYEKVCSNLLASWADGIIKIEVLDGERFNTDVFLGSTSLLLSSFCVAPQRSKEQGSVREISGSFALEKAHITDRVSGTLFVHSYLHWPEKAFLKDLIKAPMAAAAPSGAAVSSISSPAAENAESTNFEEDVTHTPSSSSPPRPPSPSATSSSLSMCSNPAPTGVLKLLAKHKSNWGKAGVRRSRIRLVGEASPEASEAQQEPQQKASLTSHFPSPTNCTSVGGGGSGGGSGSRMSRLADLGKLITGLESVALDAELVLESYQEKLEGASSAKKLVKCTSPITTKDS